MRRLAEERSRLFDQQAECYDRCRPTYPDAVIDELLGPRARRPRRPRRGLRHRHRLATDGRAGRQRARRRSRATNGGDRPHPWHRRGGRRLRGLGRRWPHLRPGVSAQAWHWLDLPVSTAKAASLLRPGGRLCLIWSAGCHPDDLADALAEVYARLFPTVGSPGFGYAASRPSDRRSRTDLGHRGHRGGARARHARRRTGSPGPASTTGDQWLDLLLSAATMPPSTPGQRAPVRSDRRRPSMTTAALSS